MTDTHEHIIEHVLPVFKNFGVKSVSMDDVSKTLGISKKTLYNHFDSKEQLIETAISFIFNKHQIEVERISKQDANAIEKIISIYKYGISQLAHYQTSFYFELEKYYPSIYNTYLEQREAVIYKTIKALFKEAQLNKEIVETLNVELYCKLNLYRINAILTQTNVQLKYDEETILNHLLKFNLKGIVIKQNKLTE